MKKLLLILLCLPMIGFGQSWQRTYSINTGSFGISVNQTNDGGYIIAGIFGSDSNSPSKIYLIKTDIAGNMQWDNTFAGIGNFQAGFSHSVQQTTDGGYIISGQEQDTGQTKVLLIKANNLGNQQWQQFYGINSSVNEASSVQQTTDGGYMIYALKNSTDEGGGSLWLIKINSDGTFNWEKEYDDLNYGIGGYGHGTVSATKFGCQTTDGGYLLAGSSFLPSFTRVIRLIKTNSQGDTSWTNNLSSFSNFLDLPTTVDQTSDGGYIIAATGVSSSNSREGYLLKINSTGNLVWNKVFNSAGYAGTLDANPTADGGYILLGTDTLGCPILIKTDASGNTIWSKVITGSGNLSFYKLSGNIEQTTDGGYIMAGIGGSIANVGVALIKTDGNGNVTSIFNIPINPKRKLHKTVDILGKETKPRTNTPLIEIYDDGTVEKKIVIE